MEIKICTKGLEEYVESFKDKDIYTWDEIISIIQNLEDENKRLNSELEDTKNELQEERTRNGYYE